MMKPRLLTLVVMLIGVAAMRIVPHPPNFTPIGALALFAGAHFARLPLALCLPLAVLWVSDMTLGFTPAVPVYLCFILCVGMGRLIQHRVTAWKVGGISLASAVLFFVVTNFAVFVSSGMYPKSMAGLLSCYVAAIPFFQNSLAGNVFFSAVLFGGFAIIDRKFFLPVPVRVRAR